MIVPFEMINDETLRNLIEEFVSRNGTDNGYDQNLEDRVERVMASLKRKELVVVFDHASETANIISREQAVLAGYDSQVETSGANPNLC